MFNLPIFGAPAGSGASIVENLVVILVMASLVSLLFQRLRLAIIPAYICAGVIAGPSVLGLARSVPALQEIAHLAVVFLLFGVGMELHLSSLRHRMLQMLGSSFFAVVFCILALFPLGLAAGFSWYSSLVIAMAFSLSSTAVVLRLLALRRELATAFGQLSLAVLVVQDLLVLAMLASLPLLAQLSASVDSGSTGGGHSLSGIAISLGGVTILVFAARLLLPQLLKEANRDPSGELTMLVGVAVALITAWLTEALGFSLEMGAFLAGFILAGSPFRMHLSGKIAPLRDLFMAIFFTALGMELALEPLAQYWWQILLAVVAVLFLKAASISIAAFICGVSIQHSLRVGLILCQAGEFSLVLLHQAGSYDLVPPAMEAAAISVVVFSLILTPSIIGMSGGIAQRFSATRRAPWFTTPTVPEVHISEELPQENFVVLAGFGPVGQFLHARLCRQGIPSVILETNPDTVLKQRADGTPIVYGDSTTEHVLQAINIEKASHLVYTFPNAQAALVGFRTARRIAPNLKVVARAATYRDRQRLTAAGIDVVLTDEDAAAETLFQVLALDKNLPEARLYEEA